MICNLLHISTYLLMCGFSIFQNGYVRNVFYIRNEKTRTGGGLMFLFCCSVRFNVEPITIQAVSGSLCK